ncbi:putative mitochondrial C-terminal Peptidase_S8_Subtilisin domain-containing protein [Andalucia godoyi]|uniref:Putative mitochondrial C-terminal Peptidase_S8_Subtilisin domain-containing protein n=1 Tax=Andalucia godoyi TaxID=505711 RepID=A0A8K0AGT8_ANDGO|nr:putative mitochondrial C-terminal Peptidase_S8_Subtilisin domain-containing protein [Andalucia godoyi]|eukprot:ANDGO_08779.mRNA.1 putative mitochondrial C-terminal Peptidase_S8_Subtilisin domain-containing protein
MCFSVNILIRRLMKTQKKFRNAIEAGSRVWREFESFCSSCVSLHSVPLSSIPLRLHQFCSAFLISLANFVRQISVEHKISFGLMDQREILVTQRIGSVCSEWQQTIGVKSATVCKMACAFKRTCPNSHVEWVQPSLDEPDTEDNEQRKNLSLFKKESEDFKCVVWDETDPQRQESVASLQFCSSLSVRNLVSYDSVVLDRPSKRVALNESARPWFTKWFGDFATLIDGDGEGITVDIVDSGCDLHQFQDVNSSLGTFSGKSFVNNAWFIDVDGHGTHVARIIRQILQNAACSLPRHWTDTAEELLTILLKQSTGV